MNPDDLLALIRNATIGLRGDPNRANPQGLPDAELAKLRQGIAKARADGISDDDINAYLTETYGKSLQDVTTPTRRDYARAAVPFNLGDEMAGIAKVLPLRGQLGATPGSYTEARDATRENMRGASAIAPKRMLAAQVLGSMPLAAVGGPAAQGLSSGARAVQAAETGGLLGALSGFGGSEANTLGGLLDDTGAGTVMGAGVGLAGSGLGSLIRGVYNKLSPTQTVMRNAEAMLPDDYAASIARQETLAPGTATIAGQSERAAKLAGPVGADLEAAVQARKETLEFAKALQRSKREVGKRYQAFTQKLAVDDELKTLVGKKLDLGDEVDFKTIHEYRSEVGERLFELSKAARKGKPGAARKARKLAPVKEGLDTWLRARVSGLDKVDSDYGFIAEKAKAAQRAAAIAEKSLDAHALGRIAGTQPVSGGATVQKAPGLMDVLNKAIAPNRAKRARIVEKLLLSPEGRETALRLLSERESMFPSLGRGLLFGTASSVPGLER